MLKLLIALLLLVVAFAALLPQTLVAGAGTCDVGQSGCSLQVPSLMFHEITDSGTLGDWVTRPDFLSQVLDWIAAQGYTTVTITDIVNAMNNKAALPCNPIHLRFDDGWRSQQYAVDELRKRNMNATFFIISGYFDYPDYVDTSLLMDWSTTFEIGAHTRQHNYLTQSTDLIDDTIGSATDIEGVINRPVKYFAYPYGDYNQAVEDVVSTYFEVAISCDSGTLWSCNNMYALPTIDMNCISSLTTLENTLQTGNVPWDCVADSTCQSPYSAYTIASGDTCYHVWTNNGMTSTDFYAANPSVDCTSLEVGDTLCVSSSDGSQSTPTTTPTPVPTPSSSASSSCEVEYSIQSGDTCYQVWTNNGMTSADFYAANPDVECTNLVVGAGLCIFSSGSQATPTLPCQLQYVVQAGDTCYQLWTNQNMSYDQFYALNPGVDCTNLLVGATICLG